MLLALGGRRHRRPVLAVGSDRSSCNHESGLFYRYTAPDLCIYHRGHSSGRASGYGGCDELLSGTGAKAGNTEGLTCGRLCGDHVCGIFYNDVRCLQPDGSGGLEGHSTVLHAVTLFECAGDRDFPESQKRRIGCGAVQRRAYKESTYYNGGLYRCTCRRPALDRSHFGDRCAYRGRTRLLVLSSYGDETFRRNNGRSCRLVSISL